MSHRGTELDRPDLKTLDDLYRAMTDPDDLEQKEWLWPHLPLYGGEPPEDDFGVWSWDEHRLLVGTHYTDLRLVDRKKWRGNFADLTRRWGRDLEYRGP